MDLGIPPLEAKIMLESNPRKSTMLVGRLGVHPRTFYASFRRVEDRHSLIHYSTCFAAFEEHLRSTSSVRQVVPQDVGYYVSAAYSISRYT